MVYNAEHVNSRPIRVGLIGAGNWALRGHLPVLQLTRAYEITGIHTSDFERSSAIARRFCIRHVAKSIQELAQSPDVDMVIVLTTAPQHEKGIRAAIEARKDVYCEWPLTPDANISQELAVLAEAAGVRHVFGLQRRLAPFSRYLHDLLSNGYVGQLRSVRLHVSMNYFKARLRKALRWTVPPGNFSSVMPIYGGHFLDALFSITGFPASFSAVLVNQFPEVLIEETGEVLSTTNPDQLVIAGKYDGTAVLSVRIEGGKRNSGVQLDITGDEGDLRVTNRSAFGDLGDDYRVEGARGDNIPLRSLPTPDAYSWISNSNLPSSVLELAHLYSAYSRDVRVGNERVPTFDDAVRIHRFLDLALEASEHGRHVMVKI
jgi:predicted dehydrogenase